jgi:hypothetical protein
MVEMAGENKKGKALIYVIRRTQPRHLPAGELLLSRTRSVINLSFSDDLGRLVPLV